MSFEEYWKIIGDLDVLSQEAYKLIPKSLSKATKEKMCERQPREVAEIVQWAIRKINVGSVEKVDDLVNQKL